MLIVALLGVVWTSIRFARRARQRRRDHERLSSLAEVTALLTASLRAGRSTIHAVILLAHIAPDVVRDDFRRFRDGIATGMTPTDALVNLRDDLGPHFRPLIGILMSSLRLGVPAETLLVQLNVESRYVHRALVEESARQLPVRLALPLVMCTLPSFVILIIVPVIAGTLAQLHTNGR